MYRIEKIISSQEVLQLIELNALLEVPSDYQEKYYNVYNVMRTHIRGEHLNHPSIQKINSFIDIKCRDAYFLTYSKNSWTNLHRDHVAYDGTTACTVVTMLDCTGLKGGEALMGSSIKSNRFYENTNHHERIKVENLASGESIVYDKDQRHGVGNVFAGKRQVLVQWFE